MNCFYCGEEPRNTDWWYGVSKPCTPEVGDVVRATIKYRPGYAWGLWDVVGICCRHCLARGHDLYIGNSSLGWGGVAFDCPACGWFSNLLCDSGILKLKVLENDRLELIGMQCDGCKGPVFVGEAPEGDVLASIPEFL